MPNTMTLAMALFLSGLNSNYLNPITVKILEDDITMQYIDESRLIPS